ncbi:MAG: dihydroneopterin aldolase [Candidatus Zixiibacteriota bacterium]|nr:MAG: dihydroneopterin aldolase [candidate division Zixibacteria bacterium]
MKDIIRLTGLSFYGYHGVSAAEKETGHAFEVDCELEVDIARAGHSDQLTDTVDYSEVYATIKDVVEGKAYALVEGLASELATLLLDRFAVYSVTLRVRKLHPPIAGPAKHIEIEVTRYQTDSSKLADRTNINNE